jgi:signal transduction histidine kinase
MHTAVRRPTWAAMKAFRSPTTYVEGGVMWRTLASRVYGCIAAVLVIALAASSAAVFTLRQTSHSMETILEDNLPSVIAGEELELALLEQRGCVSSFLLSGGDDKWLQELHDKQKDFQRWHASAMQIAYTEDERQALQHLARVVQRYDARREAVIDLFRSGQSAEAQQILFTEVNDLYHEAYRWCEQLIAINKRLMEKASQDAVGTVERVSLGMFGAIGLQLSLIATLLWTFYRAVLGPLQQMAVDLRGYSPVRPQEQRVLGDEVELIAKYLRLLLMDAADYRSTLESQRRQLFDAQKMASVGRLAANLAHEIRNPLTAMKMWLFSVRGAISEGSEVARTLDSVTQEVRRLEAIVKQFLEFSRPPSAKLAWTSVAELISGSASLVEPLLREKGVHWRQELSPALPQIYVDREQMMQVLVNLLRNAAESVPPKGSVVVLARREINSAGHEEAVLLVRDNGPGIPADLQSRVFEPFFTTKEDGTGLGLSIVDSIVVRHGGRVEVQSIAEGGTEIAIHLPGPRDGEPK